MKPSRFACGTGFSLTGRTHAGYSCVGNRTFNLDSDGVMAMKPASPTREQTIERLVASEHEIRALGVARLALFGSVLRGDARPDSDIDLVVQFSPGAKSFHHFLALSELLEERLGRRVELVTTEALSPFLGPRILAEAQDVIRAA
jgi:predicted nucleotidyltransferase